MPSGNDAAGSYTSNLDRGGLQLSGTNMVVNHFRHVWGVWHGQFILGFTLDAAGIRAEIANGQFKVVGRTELHRQQAVELEINVPPNNEAPPHVTAARLWVDATSYLPMQEYLRMSNGQQSVTDYIFLPANAREPGETAAGNPGGLHPRQIGGLVRPETEDEVAYSATAKRPVAGPLRRHRHRARKYRPAQLQGRQSCLQHQDARCAPRSWARLCLMRHSSQAPMHWAAQRRCLDRYLRRTIRRHAAFMS
jgi:hypothetical protein